MNKAWWMIVVIAAAVAAGYLAGSRGMTGDERTAVDAVPAEREILYWVAPMDPDYRRDEPGKSPMGMDLVPVYADEADSGDGIRISPSVENNLGVRVETARTRPLWRRVEATGYVGFDETRISHITIRTEGWISRLIVDAEGERVSRGDVLFELYSPELVNAQKEYLQAVRRQDERLVSGAAEKLAALGMIAEEIRSLAESGTVRQNTRVVAPQDGVVSFLGMREGMYVQPNTMIMSLADLSSVWLQAEIFESQAEWVAVGQAAEAALNYLPGRAFTGQVDYVYPILDPATRTLKVRLRFDNPDEALKPNMYARVSVFGRLQPEALSISRDALIRGQDADRVVVALGDGRFRVHEVIAGMESGDWVEILAGIEPGDRVVTSAQFLIDSEASLAGSIRRLDAAPERIERSTERPVVASGRIEAIDRDRRRVRIAHGPIDDIGWPSMTMYFDVLPGARLEGISEGQDVRFILRQQHAGEYAIEQLGVGAPEVDAQKADRKPDSEDGSDAGYHQHD